MLPIHCCPYNAQISYMHEAHYSGSQPINQIHQQSRVTNESNWLLLVLMANEASLSLVTSYTNLERLHIANISHSSFQAPLPARQNFGQLSLNMPL